MKKAQDFKLETSFALLLIGLPFSGKTNAAFQFPNPYILDADDKLANAVRRNTSKDFHFDCPLRDDNDKPVPHEQRWEHSVRCLNVAAAPNNGIDTIVIDSASAMSDFLTAHILRFPAAGKSLIVGGEKVMDQSMWRPFQDLWKKLIMGLRASGKLIVVICHEDIDKDEATGIMMHRPLIPGALKNMFASMFTDVWRCETQQVPDPSKPGQMMTKYLIRTQPTAKMALGNSLGLPAEFVMSWEELSKKLTMPAQKATTITA